MLIPEKLKLQLHFFGIFLYNQVNGGGFFLLADCWSEILKELYSKCDVLQ
jgi:hypothetical protein